jgi:hypothetical protein
MPKKLQGAVTVVSARWVIFWAGSCSPRTCGNVREQKPDLLHGTQARQRLKHDVRGEWVWLQADTYFFPSHNFQNCPGHTKSPVHVFFSPAYRSELPFYPLSLLSTCFSLLHTVQNCPLAHEISYPVATADYFVEGNEVRAWMWPFSIMWYWGLMLFIHSSGRRHSVELQ